MARVVASSPRPTDSRNDATVNGNRYQLLGAGVWSIAPRSQVSARSCTSLSSWSHSHGRVSDRPSATDADSTIGWPCTWWSRISGHDSVSSRPGVRVPAVRPCAYRSSQPCGSFPPAPATRKPAARNVRAKPSRPSERTPDPEGRPGRSSRAPPGVAQRHAAPSSPSATASQCARVYPVIGLNSRFSWGISNGMVMRGTPAFRVVRDGRSRRPRPTGPPRRRQCRRGVPTRCPGNPRGGG